MKFTNNVIFWLVIALGNHSVFAQEPDNEPVAKRTPRFTEQGIEACLHCHSGAKMHAIAASVHGNLDQLDMPLAVQGCEACHGPGSIHVSRAHGGLGFPPLTTFGRGADASPREEQINACMACHQEDIGSVSVIEFFGSPHDRRNINCSTCHVVHVESDPIRNKEHQDSTCYRCHRKQKTRHPRFEDKSINFDALTCWTCHDVHKVIASSVIAGKEE